MAIGRQHRPLRAVVLIVLGLVACTSGEGEALELPPVMWEGEHVAFGVSERAGEYCAGTPAYLDRYAAGLLEVLDRPPLEEKIRFSFFARDEVPDWETGTLGRSTAQGVVSGVPVLEHELVHAVLRPDGFTHPLVEEGLAEFFGGDGYFSFREDTGLPLGEALAKVTDGRLPGEYYGVAGRFMAHVDETFGREVVFELDDLLDAESSTVEFAAAFSAASEVPLDEAVQQFEGLEACPQKDYRDPSAACLSAEPLAWCEGAETAEYTVELSCDSPDVVGVRDGEIWTYRLLSIPAPGKYAIYMWPPAPEGTKGYFEIKQCTGGCNSFYVREYFPTGLMPAIWYDLEEPGEYILKIAVERSAELMVQFKPLGVDCE